MVLGLSTEVKNPNKPNKADANHQKLHDSYLQVNNESPKRRHSCVTIPSLQGTVRKNSRDEVRLTIPQHEQNKSRRYSCAPYSISKSPK